MVQQIAPKGFGRCTRIKERALDIRTRTYFSFNVSRSFARRANMLNLPSLFLGGGPCGPPAYPVQERTYPDDGRATIQKLLEDTSRLKLFVLPEAKYFDSVNQFWRRATRRNSSISTQNRKNPCDILDP